MVSMMTSFSTAACTTVKIWPESSCPKTKVKDMVFILAMFYQADTRDGNVKFVHDINIFFLKCNTNSNEKEY